MNKLKRKATLMAAFIERLGKALEAVASVILLAMMVIVTTEVFLRYVLKTSLRWSFEMTDYMMIAVVFLGAAYVQAEKQHIRMDLMITRLTGRVRTVLEIVSPVLGLIMFSLITWKGWQLAWFSLQEGSMSATSTPMPLFASQVLVPIGSFVLCLQFLLDIFRYISSQSGRG